MTITYAHVQSGTADTNPATVALTVTAGNLLVVHALERSGTTEANFTISDTAGNTWTKRVGRDIALGDSSFRRTWVVWTAVANGSGSTTVSVDNGTANAIRIIFSEVEAGAAVTWSFEAAASNDNGTTSDATSIATGTTASVGAGDLLLIGGFGLKKNSGSATAMNMSWASSSLANFTSAPVPLLGNDRFIAVALLQESGAGTKASTATIDSDNGSNNGLAASILVFSATEGGGTITGTGAVTLGAITVAGTAGRTVPGTGAIELGAIEVDGLGSILGEVTGTGEITLGAIEVAGTAERQITDVGGAIDLVLPAITVSGTGTAGADLVTGTGAIELGAVTVSGTAERSIPGAGAITLGSLEVAGSGTRATDATGAITLGALQVSGQALLSITGTGAITLGALQVSGFDVAPVVDQGFTGGFVVAYERELARRRRERKKRQEREEEAERIEEETSREIARLLREQEAKDARRAELQRLSELVDTYARRGTEAALSERVQKAISKAATKQTAWALYALERELRRAHEEEEFLLSALRFVIEND